MIQSELSSKDELGPQLAVGQIWKTDKRCIQITGFGKTLIHYKLLRHPAQKAGAAMVASRNEVLEYLAEHSGSLVH